MDESNLKNNLGQPIGEIIPNWSKRLLPSRNKMEGQYCSINILNVNDHADELFKAFAKDFSSQDWTYLPYGPFENLRNFLEWLQKECIGNDPLFHTILDKTINKAVGMASYLRINPDQGVIEVGHIHFSPFIQRSSIGTEAMYLMMKRVFDELKYRRYEWKCDSLNNKSCVAAKRFIVEAEIYEDFKEAFVKKMKAIKFGDPTSNEANIGPMARKDLREKLHDQVEKSVSKGAKILCGGEVPDQKGYYYPATVLDNLSPGMPAYDDELFGPVASLIKAEDEEDAFKIANASNFGLGGGIYLVANLGAGPRDGLMVGLQQKTNLPIAAVRAFLEITVVSIGWYLGGTVGVGTLLFAFGIGPAVALGLFLTGKLFN